MRACCCQGWPRAAAGSHVRGTSKANTSMQGGKAPPEASMASIGMPCCSCLQHDHREGACSGGLDNGGLYRPPAALLPPAAQVGLGAARGGRWIDLAANWWLAGWREGWLSTGGVHGIPALRKPPPLAGLVSFAPILHLRAQPHREAIAYGLYMATNTFLSAAVVAATLFYVSWRCHAVQPASQPVSQTTFVSLHGSSLARCPAGPSFSAGRQPGAGGRHECRRPRLLHAVPAVAVVRLSGLAVAGVTAFTACDQVRWWHT